MSRPEDLPTPTTLSLAGACPGVQGCAGPSTASGCPGLWLDGLAPGLFVVTSTHRDTPVGLLLRTLAPIDPVAGVFSFSLSGFSYAWPALEKAPHIGVHALDPARTDDAALADTFARTSVDGFAPDVTWTPGRDGVPLLETAARRAVARPTQRIHVGTHVVVVAQIVEIPHPVGVAA